MQINLVSCKHHLVKVFTSEKSTNQLTGCVVGFGGSLLFMIADGYVNKNFTVDSLILISLMYVLTAIALVYSYNGVKA